MPVMSVRGCFCGKRKDLPRLENKNTGGGVFYRLRRSGGECGNSIAPAESVGSLTERGCSMLEVRNLTYEVVENGEKITIVKDINFTVGDGEMLVITGPNGGGKSTVAKLLMGVLKATGGEILLDGKDIKDMGIDERAKAGIGYAFQQPPVFKGMTIRRLLNLAAGRNCRSMYAVIC